MWPPPLAHTHTPLVHFWSRFFSPVSLLHNVFVPSSSSPLSKTASLGCFWSTVVVPVYSKTEPITQACLARQNCYAYLGSLLQSSDQSVNQIPGLLLYSSVVIRSSILIRCCIGCYYSEEWALIQHCCIPSVHAYLAAHQHVVETVAGNMGYPELWQYCSGPNRMPSLELAG